MYVIGIAGGSGSGKTTLAEKIAAMFPESTNMLCSDSYYCDHSDLTFEQRKLLNYDEPAAVDFELMASHVEQLAEGHAIERPTYDFTTHLRTGEVTVVEPRPILILEGILLLHDERLRSVMNLKIFVDTDDDVRVLRRVRRDVNERGRDVDGIIDQYLATVKPMYERYVRPSKTYADMMVSGNGNSGALDAIERMIRGELGLAAQ